MSFSKPAGVYFLFSIYLCSVITFGLIVEDVTLSFVPVGVEDGSSETINVPFANELFNFTANANLGRSDFDTKTIVAGSKLDLTFTFDSAEYVASKSFTADDITNEAFSIDVAFQDLVTTTSGRKTFDFKITLRAENDVSIYSVLEPHGVQVIQPGVSLIPLIIVIVFAVCTQMVEVSISLGVLIGAAIIEGGLVVGFKRTLDTYLVGVVSDSSHQSVILFTMFMSALVGMIEKSGGIDGMTVLLLRYAKSRTIGQFLAFLAGLMIFFDDYASCLIVGFSMQPGMDAFQVSREKLAFIADATAATVASVVPISGWVGYEIEQIGKQLEILVENYNVQEKGLSASPFTIFVQSIPYRFYPIYMIFFQVCLIFLKREFGPMLIAERKCVVYQRTDGGDGAYQGTAKISVNRPSEGTPKFAYNFFVPVICLAILIIVEMVVIGQDSAHDKYIKDPSVTQIFEFTDPYNSLLIGTFSTALVTMMFYFFQFKKNGKLSVPTLRAFIESPEEKSEEAKDVKTDEESPKKKSGLNDDKTRSLMTLSESVNSFLKGMLHVMPAIVILVLAWSIADIMSAIGANRFLRGAIEGNISSGMLPTLTFLISVIIALCTGTSWGTMAIVFPIVTIPSWTKTQSPEVVIATIGAVLSGSIAGDHCSPISDTTLLSSIASGCDLMKHVYTQLPYALTIIFWSVLVGTLPVGYSSGYPAWLGLILGFIVTLLTVIFLGAPVLALTGKFDPMTELYLLIRRLIGFKNIKYNNLREHTKEFAEANIEHETTFDKVNYVFSKY